MDRHGQLTRFINRLAQDSRLKPVHISLSVALCHRWTLGRFQRSYRVSRRILMQASRIRSKATYHRALRELQGFGYFRYKPSYHPAKGSEITMLDEISKKTDTA
jgi:hypothetical protein